MGSGQPGNHGVLVQTLVEMDRHWGWDIAIIHGPPLEETGAWGLSRIPGHVTWVRVQVNINSTVLVAALSSSNHRTLCSLLVHGHWSDWSVWSDCAATCGLPEVRGKVSKNRTCTEPEPQHNGKPCPIKDSYFAERQCEGPDVCLPGMSVCVGTISES